MDPYLILKWAHILSSTVLFGTGIGTAFQMVWAMRAGEPQVVASTASAVVVADWLFTAPAGIIQPTTGLALVWLAGYNLTEPWLLATYGLYLLALACWLPVVRLQYRIRDLARRAAAQNEIMPPQVIRDFRLWFVLGWPAFAALIMIYWLMVAKPPLWGA